MKKTGNVNTNNKPNANERTNDRISKSFQLDSCIEVGSPMAMLMIPSKVSSHVRFLLMEFNDSDYHSLAQEICEVLSLSLLFRLCVYDSISRGWIKQWFVELWDPSSLWFVPYLFIVLENSCEIKLLQEKKWCVACFSIVFWWFNNLHCSSLTME